MPDNAIYHLANAFGQLEKFPFPLELNPVTRVYFERRAGLESGQRAADMRAILRRPPDKDAVARLSKDSRYNSLLRTTCVATMLNAGHAPNALPQLAHANVNCRILPGHSPEQIRGEVTTILADTAVTVRFVSDAGEVSDRAPDRVAFPPILPPDEILKPLQRIAEAMWNGVPVIPEMETGASDSIYTVAACMPSYGVSGIAIDQDDVRAHGKDERVRVSAFYDGVEFYYRH